MIATLIEFSKSQEFVNAVVDATQAGFCGSGYSVEIHYGGRYRVFWNEEYRTKPYSLCMIVDIPQLNDEQLAEVNEEAGISLHDVVEFYRDELAAKMIDAASE